MPSSIARVMTVWYYLRMPTYSQITYHIVFGTKNRVPSIPLDHRRDLYAYIHGVIKNRKGQVLRINGMRDHIHILMSLHPAMALSDLVKEVKTASNIWMKEQDVFRSFEQWQEGYGAFTHSVSDRVRLIEYIKNQESHHAKLSFEEEFRNLVIDAGLVWDDRYLP